MTLHKITNLSHSHLTPTICVPYSHPVEEIFRTKIMYEFLISLILRNTTNRTSLIFDNRI